MLILTITGLFSVVIVLLWASRSFHQAQDLGPVSAKWLAEYRQERES
jgi:hypothetical protein